MLRLIICPALPLLVLLALAGCGGVTPPQIDLMAVPGYDLPGDTVKERLAAGLNPAEAAGSDGGEAGELVLTLQDVVVSVLRNNRDIRVAAHGPVQARAGILEAQSDYDPELFGEWEHSRNSNPYHKGGRSSNTRHYNDTERVGLRQTSPTGATVSAYREWTSGAEWDPGQAKSRGHGGAYVLEMTQPLLNGFGNRETRANIAISRVQYDRSEEELRRVMINTTADALEAYWNLALAREDIRIYQETLGMAESLLAREITRQREGISTELDVERAREAVATRTVNLINARDQEHMYQERMKLLLNKGGMPVGSRTRLRAAEALDTPPPQVRLDLERSLEAALANRPEMRQADLAIQAGEVREKYARHSLLPRLDLVGRVRDNDRSSDRTVPGYDVDTLGHDWAVGMMFSIPLGNMKARAGLQRAESELKQALDEMKSARDIIVAETKIAVKSLELIAQEIPQSQRAVAAALKVVEGEWARFELNQVGNRDLLQAQDLLAVSERNRIQNLVRYNNAMVGLLAAEGTLLDHLGIALN